jgi:hypothetical protein
MKKGPIVAVLVLGAVALFLVAPIHAMVREANTLFAMGFAERFEAGHGRPGSNIALYAHELPAIPGFVHWVCFAAGAGCLISGLRIVRASGSCPPVRSGRGDDR